MISQFPGLLQVREERIPRQLVLPHPSGEGWKVPSEPVGLDQPVVVVEAHHGVLGVPRHVDHLGCGQEVGREKAEREMRLYKSPLVLIVQHLGTVTVTFAL